MPFDPDLFKRALDFAARVHGAQKVPGSGFPYVVHVAKVAMEVMAAADADGPFDLSLAVACALLHDTVEDAGSEEKATETLGAIRDGFGPRVADGVAALTKDESVAKPERMGDSLRRIRAQPQEVWRVKLADRITNLEPPPAHWPVEKCRAYRDEAKVILRELGAASASLRARFERKLEEYEAYCR
jgi:(p)ppGpp synthase/HD superfamily hydrolase